MRAFLFILLFSTSFSVMAESSKNKETGNRVSQEFFENAVKRNDLEDINYFFEHGGLGVDFIDNSPLSIVIYEGSPEALELLLKAKSIPKKDAYNSLLSLLINMNEEKKALVLMDYISNPNFVFVQRTGITLLHDASSRGMITLCKELVGKGAKPELETITGQIPITNAINENAYDVYSYLITVTDFDELSLTAIDRLISSALRNKRSSKLFNELVLNIKFSDNDDVYVLLTNLVKQYRKDELLEIIAKYKQL